MAQNAGPRPFQLGLTIFLGYVSIAIAFGAAGRQLGFPLVVLASFSVFVFAGASQFLAVQLLASGVGGLSIVLATFVLNARHIVMSLALRDRIEGNRIPRPVTAFGVTDEIFASAAARPGSIRDTELLTVQIMAYSGWVSGTIAGYLAEQFLPASVGSAMGIAMYAMFVALIVPSILRFWRYGIVSLAAGGLNWALVALGTPRGIALLVAIVSVAVLFSVTPAWSEA